MKWAKDTLTAMPSTTKYQNGDIVLVDFPFTTSGQGKPRPALVVLDSGDADVLLARVTTQTHGSQWDVSINDWPKSGLLAASVVRLHKLATIAKSRVRRTIGRLSTADRQMVSTTLNMMFQNW